LAQNLYWEKEGAFTGEVSGPMIKAAGCSHVIVGHSERRQYFGESNESVLTKTRAALKAGLTPIACVGERDKPNMENVLIEQFHDGIGSLSKKQFAGIVIAYEPVWAIGTGNADTPETAPMRSGSSAHKRKGDSETRRMMYASCTVAAPRRTTRRVTWRSPKSTGSCWVAPVSIRLPSQIL
jgi:triosephosphate isomerase